MIRLRELQLERFGHFTGRTHDFGPRGAAPDFHILYGANEAGKTTTMEAVLRLFYGFPLREPYAFHHGRANLRLSARIETPQGLRAFTRLPTRTGSLTDETGTPLPEAALAGLLGGLTEGDYRNLLCLDDATIEKGGEEIAQARGDIGRLLFSAAAGVADLSRVLDGLRAEADGLWRKRAKTTTLADLRRKLGEIDQQLRAVDVSAVEWKRLKKGLAAAEAAETAARDATAGLRLAGAEIEARRRALPLRSEAEALTQALAPFAAWPDRLDIDPEALVELVSAEAARDADLIRLGAEIDRLDAALAAVELRPEDIALGPELEALEELHARARTARLDLDRRREALAGLEAGMDAIWHDLGTAPLPVPTLADLARLQAARDACAEAAATPEDRAEMEALVQALASAEADLAAAEASPVPPDPRPALQDHDAEGLAPRWIAAQQLLRSKSLAFEAALRALTRGAVRFETLPPCPVTEPRLQDWLARREDLARRSATLTEAEARHRSEAAAREAEAASLAPHLPPDAGRLADERDRLWTAHRAALDSATAEAFHAAMRALDAALRSRIENARDLGALRLLEQERAAELARAAAARENLLALDQQVKALEAEIRAAGAGLGLDLSPAEWRDWRGDHARAAQAEAEWRAAEAEARPVLARGEALLAALMPLTGLAVADLEPVLTRARALAEEARLDQEARQRLTETRDRASAELARRKARVQIAEATATAAETEWTALVGTLLPGLSPRLLLTSLAPLHALREAETGRADAARRIAQMEDDAARFAAEVARLAGPFETSAEEAYAALRRRVEAATRAEALHADLQTRRAAAEAARRDHGAAAEAAASHVARLAALFPAEVPTATLSDLRRAAAQGAQVIADRAALRKAEAALCAGLGLPDAAAARRALDAATPAGLSAEAENCAARLREAEAAEARAIEARVQAAGALAAVSGDAEAARLLETRALVELELEEAARHHLELHLGLRLAETAIRRYRDSHRSGMLAETERCFALLTEGAYPQLRVEPEGETEVLLAVDPAGRVKRAADMSKGTRFQLYLALRAAAHGQMGTQGLSLPFFCDDIFETFDEGRTAAACRVMEEIGKRGQAIYLTHHRHVVEIAQKVCAVPPKVHEI